MDLEDEAVLACHPVAFDHLGHVLGELRGLRQLSGRGVHPHIGCHPITQRPGIEFHAPAADHARLFQPGEALAGGRGRMANPARQLRDDQIAMARLPRTSFALLLSLLPATATSIGILLLGQIPSLNEVAGVALVVAGVALHRPRREG